MDFLDDEADVSSDVLVPSSPPERRARPRKRRRLDSDADRSSVTEDDENDLPSQEVSGEKENKKSKYEDRIHVPAGEKQPDTFVTQLTQQYSSPSRIRGPRWMKPRKSPRPSPSPSEPHTRPRIPSLQLQPSIGLDDDFEVDDDLEMLAALDNIATNGATESTHDPNQLRTEPIRRQPLQKSMSFRQTTLHGIHTTQQEPPRTQAQFRAHNWPLMNRDEPKTHHDIDQDAMTTWVYPTNLGKIRDYQYNIIQKGLYHNLLVALPTGLGKTFIAATVMLNWYRWTKSAQLIFVAPTKPLVSQQIDACFNIAGIPRSQTTMLTGEVSPAIRAEEWQEKRVFFMTPQTLINDLKHGYCDPKKIVLVVVDEAHKATGSYAYVEVVKFLRRYNSSFRVLALTATPGKNVETVQEVIDGLGIARTEIRTEESLDIREFVHSRNIEPVLFDFTKEITIVLELLAASLQPLLDQLHGQGAAWGKDPTRITLFGLKKSWEKWQSSEAGRKAHQGVKGMVRSISVALMKVAHNIELLKYHGIRPFYHKMKLFVQEASGKAKYPKQIIDHESFQKMMSRLAVQVNNPDFEGHPKLSHLKRVVLNHFMNAGEGNTAHVARATNTRIMVFAHYRDSAEEIVRALNRHGPMIRAHVFVGQSGTKGGSEGMNQKTQLDIIQKFKAGKYNTIVATSIGEEGLDIGEVDLIVCYDCSKSPVRMLQRMGRTGRKRAGNIVLLMMRGKEEQDYAQSEDNYQKMQRKIAEGTDFYYHDDRSPRIVPKDLNPAVDKRVVEIPVENTQLGSVEPTRRKAKNAKKPPKKFHMPDGVETGFAFLGNGKQVSKAEVNGKKRTKAKDIEQAAALPTIDDVLLSTAEEQQLEDRYVHLAGTQDEYIQFVRFDACPEQQRRLGKTSLVPHSERTKTFVKAFKAMNEPSRDWTRPSECKDITDDELCLKSNAEQANSITKPTSKKSKQKPRRTNNESTTPDIPQTRSDVMNGSTGARANARSFTRTEPSSGTLRSSSIGQYDDADSFIDDDDVDENSVFLQQEGRVPKTARTALEDELSSLASLPSPSSPIPAADEEAKIPKRFLVSQESIDYDAIDEELPELENLFSSKKQSKAQPGESRSKDASASSTVLSTAGRDTGGKASGAKSRNNAKSRKRARRVLDSDEDD